MTRPDPEFVALHKAIYGESVDVREAWEIAKLATDAPDMHVDQQQRKQNAKKEGLAGALLLGMPAESIAAARSIGHAAERLKQPPAFGPPERGLGRLRAFKRSRAGAVGEAALQTANLGVGMLAARELLRKPQQQKVAKARMAMRPMNAAAIGFKQPSLKARRPRTSPGPLGKSFDANVTISKVNPYKQQVFGWAQVAAVDGQEVHDRQGDVVSIEELEKAAYNYVLDCRMGGDQHGRVTKADGPRQTATMIESMVFTPEKIEALGLPEDFPQGWWLGLKVHDEPTWELIKSGKRQGLSVHGTGRRELVEKASLALLRVDADAAAPIPARGHLRKRVAQVAGGLGHVDRGGTDATPNVHSVGSRFQMRRVDAMPNPTQVVKRQAHRDGTDQRLVDHPMSAHRALLRKRVRRAGPDHSVAKRVAVSGPQPARVRAVDVRERALGHRSWDGGHGLDISKDLKERAQAAIHPPPVARHPVVSTAVRSMGYQPQTHRLSYEMRSRPDQPYNYKASKSQAYAAQHNPSIGHHYATQVRGQYKRKEGVNPVDRVRLFMDPPEQVKKFVTPTVEHRRKAASTTETAASLTAGTLGAGFAGAEARKKFHEEHPARAEKIAGRIEHWGGKGPKRAWAAGKVLEGKPGLVPFTGLIATTALAGGAHKYQQASKLREEYAQSQLRRQLHHPRHRRKKAAPPVAPVAKANVLTPQQLHRRQKHAAFYSTAGAMLGLGAIGSKAGAAGVRRFVQPAKRGAELADRLERHTSTALAGGAGLSVLSGFNSAKLSRSAAAQERQQNRKV